MNGREWTTEDLPEIAKLEQECFSDPWTQRMLADSYLSDAFFGSLLEEEDGITAYGAMHFAGDEAEIELIATAEMYRRCGRGSKILDDLLEEAVRRNIKNVFLEVRVSNAPAQLMYLKKGFKGIYARSRYYPDGEDAIVMKKELC